MAPQESISPFLGINNHVASLNVAVDSILYFLATMCIFMLFNKKVTIKNVIASATLVPVLMFTYNNYLSDTTLRVDPFDGYIMFTFVGLAIAMARKGFRTLDRGFVLFITFMAQLSLIVTHAFIVPFQVVLGYDSIKHEHEALIASSIKTNSTEMFNAYCEERGYICFSGALTAENEAMLRKDFGNNAESLIKLFRTPDHTFDGHPKVRPASVEMPYIEKTALVEPVITSRSLDGELRTIFDRQNEIKLRTQIDATSCVWIFLMSGFWLAFGSIIFAMHKRKVKG